MRAKPDRVVALVGRALASIVQPGQTVCCALSGGADSVCLLRCLLALEEELGIQVTAVHVNHNLRGGESLSDQQFCEDLCQRLGVSLAVASLDVLGCARRQKCSEELAARQCRYDAFSQVTADWIATAHTADDNAETLLHRLVRGASLHGLTAIPAVNGRYLRPMLGITRGEIEAYLEKLQQSYVTDSTNQSDRYTRNRIRHQVVPLLQSFNPNLTATLSRTIRALTREEDYLAEQSAIAFKAHYMEDDTLTELKTLHPAIRMRCLTRLLESCGLRYDGALLERLDRLVQTGGRWQIAGDVYAVAKPGKITIVRQPPPSAPPAPIPLLPGENRLYPGLVCTVELLEGVAWKKYWATGRNVHENFANSCLDYDKIKGDVFLSPRISGVRIQLAGRSFTSSLKKCIGAKVPRARRETLHLICDGAGVVWAEYIGAAARVAVSDATTRALVIGIRPEAGQELLS